MQSNWKVAAGPETFSSPRFKMGLSCWCTKVACGASIRASNRPSGSVLCSGLSMAAQAVAVWQGERENSSFPRRDL